MRNFGIFLPCAVSSAELAAFGLGANGIPMGKSEQIFGEAPDAAYLCLAAELSNGCFDDEEFERLQADLAFTPKAYVSIHMSSTKAAYDRALEIAEAIRQRWGGRIDYSGAGGTISQQFQPPAG